MLHLVKIVKLKNIIQNKYTNSKHLKNLILQMRSLSIFIFDARGRMTMNNISTSSGLSCRLKIARSVKLIVATWTSLVNSFCNFKNDIHTYMCAIVNYIVIYKYIMHIKEKQKKKKMQTKKYLCCYCKSSNKCPSFFNCTHSISVRGKLQNWLSARFF